MTNDETEDLKKPPISRRNFLGSAAAAAVAGPLLSESAARSAPAQPAARPQAIEFPHNARGFSQPLRFEANVYDCEVTGRIPTDLSGAYVRV